MATAIQVRYWALRRVVKLGILALALYGLAFHFSSNVQPPNPTLAILEGGLLQMAVSPDPQAEPNAQDDHDHEHMRRTIRPVHPAVVDGKEAIAQKERESENEAPVGPVSESGGNGSWAKSLERRQVIPGKVLEDPEAVAVLRTDGQLGNAEPDVAAFLARTGPG